ncbi:MAG TPA: hypothetical protein VK483_15510 [Chitinophagaceae bacterium]|nr:hypothetical protein [Chitinophagaceae bacterium]
MLTALTVLLIRQYKLAGSRQEFFKWLFQSIQLYAFRAVRLAMAFLLIVTILKA